MILVSSQGFDQIVRALDLAKDGTARATTRALNRGIGAARKVEVMSIAADTGLKSTVVRDAMAMRTAVVGSPAASLTADIRRIPLIQFGARGPQPSRGKGVGVSYLGQSGGRTTLPGSFIATMRSGHTGVFMRSTTKFMQKQKDSWKKKRPAIVERFGPSIGHVFIKYRPDAIDAAEEAFLKSFDHELAGAWGGTPVPSDTAAAEANVGA